jgi:hypothetical protein
VRGADGLRMDGLPADPVRRVHRVRAGSPTEGPQMSDRLVETPVTAQNKEIR